MTLHKIVHQGLGYCPDPVTGAAAGTVGGATVGTVAAASTLHLTVGGLAASVGTFGVGATASVLATAAAPIVLPAVGCCALFGAAAGTKNWVTKWSRTGNINPWS